MLDSMQSNTQVKVWRVLKYPLQGLLFTAMSMAIVSCSGGGSGGTSVPDTDIPDTSTLDTSAPSASITFPPQVSRTEGNSITVRGRAEDDSDITVVRVNGVDATSSDNFANWEVDINLLPGSNTLSVETGDINLNSNASAASAVIVSEPLFAFPFASVLDIANNRVLVLDAGLASVMVVDLSSGVRTVLSNSSTPDADNALAAPRRITLDSANNRALLVDNGLNAVIAVDIINGERVYASR